MNDPHADAPLCRHFGSCGGCRFQDMADDAYRKLKRDGVAAALAAPGLQGAVVEQAIESNPATRRRATFKVAKRNGAVAIGFHAAKSHEIVDMQECRVLTPALTALVPGLRAMLATVLHEGEKSEVHVTEAENGFDVALHWKRSATPMLTAELAAWATKLGLARISGNGETLIELRTPLVRFGKAQVKLPPGAFLQPTRDGETALQTSVRAALAGARSVADLFCGCGTFALPLAETARVHAVEQDGAMLDALTAAARTTQGLKPLTAEKRDLFKRPLVPAELSKFDAVLLDPPRAGAAAQAKALGQSTVARIAYVSCNPQSFARDAKLLVDAGYRMGPVTPVDQFLWSSHIENSVRIRQNLKTGRIVMRWFLLGVFGAAAVVFAASPAAAAGNFSDWIAVVVAGDNHDHDGGPSEVFDNGRHDIARDLMALGIPRDNIVQFSVASATHPGTQETKAGPVAAALWDLSSRTHAGCLLYVTSHGSPEGVVLGDGMWSPDQVANAVDNACGGRPTVVFVSACFSGVFVPALSSPERLVVTAARPDRTSFGCGSTDRYTYFDQCVLESFAKSGDFAGLAENARTCVAAREKAMGATPPSEPQIALGTTAATQLPHWR